MSINHTIIESPLVLPLVIKTSGSGIYIEDSNNMNACSIGADLHYNRCSAAHIVHCVNTYEEREALLKEMVEVLQETLKHHQGGHSEIGLKIRTVLLKAQSFNQE